MRQHGAAQCGIGQHSVAAGYIVFPQCADSSDEEQDYFKEYKVKQLLRSRAEDGVQQIEVCWEGTEEYAEHTSWQSRDILIRDGLGQMVRALEVQQQRTEAEASAAAQATRTAARGSRCQ